MSSFSISPATQLYGLQNVLYSLPFTVLLVVVARLSLPLGLVLVLFSLSSSPPWWCTRRITGATATCASPPSRTG